jgi:hypothetical protein
MRLPSLRSLLLVLAGLLPASAGQALAQPLGDPRGVMVEQVRNDQPAFMVRVDVDHPDRVYRDGELMQVRVISEKAGYLYLLYCDANQDVSCLFPNRVQTDNHIPANQAIVVPAPGATFRLRISPPFGQEVLKAVVTLQPLKELKLDELNKSDATPVSLPRVKGVKVEMADLPTQWAEHHVQITTTGRGGAVPSKERRVGLFIGINQYQSTRIHGLKASAKDALEMADVMKRRGKLDDSIVLTNEQATLTNIEEAIRRRIPAETHPGDTVIIYWSGHGGRVADDNGDEKDGYDEYLVPYDGDLRDVDSTRRTMLVDDTFGRWMQELDGRKILLLLDTCYSAGQATQAKGMSQEVEPLPGTTFDFFDGELNRAKDVGQSELAMLASSEPSQVSFERKEGDLSAMTYFLARQLEQGSTPLTLQAAYQQLRQDVPAYVEQQFPGATQTPVLIDSTTPPTYLRP